MCLVVFYFLNRQRVLNKSFGKMKSDNERICHAKGITKKVPDVHIHLGKINTKVLESSVGNRSPFWILFKQNPSGNTILSSFCILGQFFQLFSEHAYFCPAAKLLWSPQGNCFPGEWEQKDPKRHKLQSVKLILVPFYRAMPIWLRKWLFDLQMRIIFYNPQAFV